MQIETVQFAASRPARIPAEERCKQVMDADHIEDAWAYQEFEMEVRSLAEVRDNIDRLDRAIIRLVAERGTFVEAAARFKTSHADVEAPDRVEQVIAKVRALASDVGLSPVVAEKAYRAMIKAFIDVEHAAFEARRHR